ncbi:MAG: Hsp33 family molecular chaperone HslO [Clostridium sp.]|uniref:Hsp33 family molecular chaperone HslO n=1 Tax=Clostridium sp. TaxID=1506 RepID=UPI0025C66DE3|nr:Hsp33 family molecular chaperone HslO [Clostridium sp.]MCH3962808.1 Hsp33 family molecular chaperone HslO [Clostridium sp.]MCI1715777.1 Hsp33 family molecular chaperone HslO [Clostridium sp.]MCI1800018.1 Hsp33 family molecular chaperone HslO [Clostridium sp.]MCI1813932.1 Hsp33 family molecular chaperone HslO [Clostridium sp.]MCI1870830.1 Hsp33 family molecular chaperone HslO [Clostridium sp.]
MDDNIVRAMALDNNVRIISTTTTQLVNEAVKIHKCSATAAAALGRMLTAGSLMGTMLKSENDSLTIKISGGGAARGVIVVAYPDGSVKGYMGNPQVELPPNNKDKLDVGGAIGTNGNLVVIKDMGLKEPYVGQVPIVTGEIGDDLAYYFTVSEQTPSAVAVGVLVDRDLTIKAAGGFIIQMMPDCEENTVNFVMDRIKNISSVTDMIVSGMDAGGIVKTIFKGADLKILDEIHPVYKCNCSREKVERALISIGAKDLKEIYDDGKTEELNCNFCNKSYKFTHEQIGQILKSATNR